MRWMESPLPRKSASSDSRCRSGQTTKGTINNYKWDNCYTPSSFAALSNFKTTYPDHQALQWALAARTLFQGEQVNISQHNVILTLSGHPLCLWMAQLALPYPNLKPQVPAMGTLAYSFSRPLGLNFLVHHCLRCALDDPKHISPRFLSVTLVVYYGSSMVRL